MKYYNILRATISVLIISAYLYATISTCIKIEQKILTFKNNKMSFPKKNNTTATTAQEGKKEYPKNAVFTLSGMALISKEPFEIEFGGKTYSKVVAIFSPLNGEGEETMIEFFGNIAESFWEGSSEGSFYELTCNIKTRKVSSETGYRYFNTVTCWKFK